MEQSEARRPPRATAAISNYLYGLNLVTLHQLGGRARTHEVLARVERQALEQLSAAWGERYEQGRQYRSYVQFRAAFEHKNAKLNAMCASDARHGHWELTEGGRQVAEALMGRGGPTLDAGG